MLKLLRRMIIGRTAMDRIESAKVLLLSMYSSNQATGANIRFEALTKVNIGILGLSFELEDNNVIGFCYNTRSRIFRYILVYVYLLLLFDKKIVYDTPPLFSFSSHWYLLHDVGGLFPNIRRSNFLRSAFLRILIRRRVNIVTVSNATRRILQKMGFSDNKIVVSYNGVYPPKFICTKKEYDFCFITSGEKHKRDLHIINLLRFTYPYSKIVVISKSNIFEDLISESRSVHKFCSIDESDKFRIISQSRYYVNYSLCEGFGIPVIEAACVNVPSIVINSAINRELAKDLGVLTLIPRYCREFRLSNINDNNFETKAPPNLKPYNWLSIAEQLITDI